MAPIRGIRCARSARSCQRQDVLVVVSWLAGAGVVVVDRARAAVHERVVSGASHEAVLRLGMILMI